MSNFKIIGPSNPEVGKEIIYKTSNSNLPLSLPGQIKPEEKNPFSEQVKWSIYILEYGKWILKEKNNKTGLTANYTFTEKSLRRQGIRIVALFGNEKATLDIKPQHSIERKIVKVELCDALGNLQTKPFAYNQTVLARVHCLNLDNCTVHVTLWEDDAPGAGHSEINKNNKAITKSELISNGIADVKFKLAPDFAKMADAQVAKGAKSEGKMHEYYVTAEVFRQQTKSSNNINVINPNDKVADAKAAPHKPASKKPATKPAKTKPVGPAAKKAPSKKQEKKIPEPASGTLYDWGESVLKAMSTTLPDPVEIVNSIAKVFTSDNNKDEKKKGNCYCNRDITPLELTKMVKNIRDNTHYGGKTITFFHSDKLFYLYAKVPKADRTFEKFAEVLNKAFKKHEITTCARKIHFLANMYVETMYFTATREGKGSSNFRYDPYRGRGFQHLTWEDNYGKYKKETGVDIVSDYEKVADDLNIAADTGAWYWKKTGINDYADKDSIFDTSRLINYPGASKSSSINGYKDREIAWRELKKIFKFPQDCVSTKKVNTPAGENCIKCKVVHYDLTDKVKWQTQFDPKWGGSAAQNVACKKTCDDILSKNGLTSTSKFNKFQTALENSNHTLLVINTEESKRGIKYLDLQLKEGNPVQVGVDHDLNYKGGTLNEGTTDHFIVIIGKSCENGKVYYRFYDVGTRHENKGASDSNRLYLNTSDYSLKGKTAYNNHNYTVTQIRNNNKK